VRSRKRAREKERDGETAESALASVATSLAGVKHASWRFPPRERGLETGGSEGVGGIAGNPWGSCAPHHPCSYPLHVCEREVINIKNCPINPKVTQRRVEKPGWSDGERKTDGKCSHVFNYP